MEEDDGFGRRRPEERRPRVDPPQTPSSVKRVRGITSKKVRSPPDVFGPLKEDTTPVSRHPVHTYHPETLSPRLSPVRLHTRTPRSCTSEWGSHKNLAKGVGDLSIF